MHRRDNRPLPIIALRLPVIALVLAFTAVPFEVRPVRGDRLAAIRVDIDFADAVENVVGYIPIGLVFARRSLGGAVAAASGISLLAETSQLFSPGRSPSVTDILTNVLGALVGVLITARWRPEWRVTAPTVAVDERLALQTAMLALACAIVGAWMVQRDHALVYRSPASLDGELFAVNAKAKDAPGRLEGWWTFDDGNRDVVQDSSGNGLNGRLVSGARLGEGIDGRALSLNGRGQWMDLADTPALRPAASETVTAWINSSSFPRNDAAIFSNLGDTGLQLDTTVDSGPRTIGFKLADSSSRFIARYGRTMLEMNRWYHVAGVFDARAMTLHVYLNGLNDDGCLVAAVEVQGTSRTNTYVGRRGSQEGYEFIGSIDDVRVYSRALTQNEIMASITETLKGRTLAPAALPPGSRTADCLPPLEARNAGFIVAFGMLITVAAIGLWPTNAYRLRGLVLSVAGGLLFLAMFAPTPPRNSLWLIPLLSLAGGLCARRSIAGFTSDAPVERPGAEG